MKAWWSRQSDAMRVGIVGGIFLVVAAFIGLFSSGSVVNVNISDNGTPTAQSVSQTTSIDIFANQGWQDTGVSISERDVVIIDYIQGKWTPRKGVQDPISARGYDGNIDDFIKGSRLAALIGKLGDDLFVVGEEKEFVAQRGGRLFLRINDSVLDDNEGFVNIKITVQK